MTPIAGKWRKSCENDANRAKMTRTRRISRI
jgi:hypothetical protein